MYVASEPDRAWLFSVQRKLYTRSRDNLDYVFRKLWGLVTDPHNLRMALARVARNRGRRTSGVDRVTVATVLRSGVEQFVADVRADLRSGRYAPSPVRRVLIPKTGQPGKFRPLGIPTVRDRVVQAALKNILEPVFEADFYPSSNGFRPGKGVHRALEQIRKLLRPRYRPTESKQGLSYQWAIEGDIKGCFDNIDHHALMVRLRRRIGDSKVIRLVRAFLKAGVLSGGQIFRTDSGTPQGGILSPLLANVALSVIDERYERYVWPRRIGVLRTDPKEIEKRALCHRNHDRNRGKLVYYPIRYADDFIILVGAPRGASGELAREAAFNEKAALAQFLKDQLNLELSESKTKVTPVTATMRFLGHHVLVRRRPGTEKLFSITLIPKDRSQRLRWLVKKTFARSSANASLANRLQFLNPMLRGWAYFYRHACGAKRVFSSIDHHVWWAILRWLRKKHLRTSVAKLAKRYGWRKRGCHGLRWQDGGLRPFELASVPVRPFMLWSQNPPAYAQDSAESPVHNERCTPGSEGGPRKPADESR